VQAISLRTAVVVQKLSVTAVCTSDRTSIVCWQCTTGSTLVAAENNTWFTKQRRGTHTHIYTHTHTHTHSHIHNWFIETTGCLYTNTVEWYYPKHFPIPESTASALMVKRDFPSNGSTYDDRSQSKIYTCLSYVTQETTVTDCIKGISRRTNVICFQRWSKILVATNLKMIARLKQLWHHG
jgi:hypothetical protein